MEYKIEPQRETAYRFALIDENYEHVAEAVKRWIKTEKWPPKSSELLSLAGEIADETYKALPKPEYVWTEDDYQRMLRMEILAQDMGISLHPNEIARLGRERAKRKATA